MMQYGRSETLLGGDAQGRRGRQVGLAGPITRSASDSLGRLSNAWVGDGGLPTSGTRSPANHSGGNLTKVPQ